MFETSLENVLIGTRNADDLSDEKRRRQLERVNKRKSINSPLLSSIKRKTLTPQLELNAAQLKEHYSMCIQLCSTNKINSKNAFGLHIIDYMNQLITSNKDGNINFKFASSTLDVGTKIYSNRVDNVNAQAYKVASNLLMALDDKKSKDKPDDDSDLADNDEPTTKPKNQKQKKNINVIASVNSLTLSKHEYENEQDEVFLKLSSTIDAGSSNNFLIDTLNLNTCYKVRIDSSEPYYQNNLLNDLNEIFSSHEIITKFENILNKENCEICPCLNSFNFDNINDSFNYGQNSAYAFRNLSTNDALQDNFLSSNDFDIDEDVENIYNTSNDNEDFEMNNDFNLANKSVMNTGDDVFIGSIINALSENPTDYCLFNKKVLYTWAGHEYWKPNPVYRMQFSKKNLESQNQDKTKKNKKIFEDINFDDAQEEFSSDGDKKLKQNTFKKWMENKSLILPRDYGRKPIDFITPFLSKMFKCLRKSDENKEKNYDQNVDDYFNNSDLSNNNYSDLDKSDEFVMDNCDVNNQDNENDGLMPFVGDNLVDQPYMIQQVQLPYTKFAKKIDVKKLKSLIWDLIDDAKPNLSQANQTTQDLSISSEFEEINHSNETNEVNENSIEDNKKISLLSIYKTLPGQVNTTMAKNLSIPITLVTLLHVVNEKNLTVQVKDDFTDCYIMKDKL